MEEKESTIHENPSPEDGATVLHGHSPVTHIAPGRRVGHYTIREVLGEGGFAVVYLAEQTEPVRRRVALKVIKLGMDTKQVLARFEAERQALAMMDHPNVAKVFDAGVTGDGRSYFVMEHVPGVPITEHCDRQRLNIEQRLALFTQVCDAVQHAHQKGIIHRDIKPSNVLVSVKEGSAVPKVIDFGVAKALHQKLTEKTLFTEQGQLIGTPEYMSPEQAEMTAQDIDTRSDIYSLGVLLYELLTGALPFDPKSLRKAAFAEIQRIIRQEQPPKPSTKLSSLGDASTTNADNRRLDPRSLMRELRGDLDWIVMKALEKDRERRYETANAFAMDLQRHLSHEPVLAGPPSATYKLRKFVRRNRGGVFAAGAVLGVLILGVAGTTWGWVEAIDARDAERDAKTQAQTDQEIAQTVNDFLNNDLLAAVVPSVEQGKGKDVLMRDVLDVAAQRIEEAAAPGGKFADKPLIEASIRATLGWTYRELGEYPVAEPHLERARELRLRELGEEHPSTLYSMNNLAILYDDQGLYDEAESLYVKILETNKRILGKEHPDTLSLMHNLAGIHMSLGRLSDAERLYDETLKFRRTVLREDHPDTLSTASNLARLYDRQGRYQEAAELASRTLEIKRRVLGEHDPSTLVTKGHLATVYYWLQRMDESEYLYVEAIRSMRRVFGDDHPRALDAMTGLGVLYVALQRYEEAEQLLTEAFQGSERVLGLDHSDTLDAMNNLGILYEAQERYAEAEPLFLRALEVSIRVLGEKDIGSLLLMNNLAALYQNWGRPKVAEPWFSRAIVLAREALDGSHVYVGAFLVGYGECLTSLGRYLEAEEALLESHEILGPSLGPSHEYVAECVHVLVQLYEAWGKPEPAAEWRGKLVEEGTEASRLQGTKEEESDEP